MNWPLIAGSGFSGRGAASSGPRGASLRRAAGIVSPVPAAIGFSALVVVFMAAAGARADEPTGKTAPAAEAKADQPAEAKKPAKVALAAEQAAVAEKYRDLERVLIRMAEITAHTDPRRAALLRQAIAQSKQQDIENQFDDLVKLLKQDSLSASIKGQNDLHGDLVKLLDLLLSEDRGKRIESEKQRIREYLRRINKIIIDQKSVQGDTINGEDAQKLAGRQGELGGKTGDLAKEMSRHEGQPGQSGDKPSSDKPSSGKPSGKQDKAEKGEKADKGEPGDKNQDQGKQDQPESGKPASGDKSQKGDAGEGKAGDKKSGDKPSDGKNSGENGKGSEGQEQGQPQDGKAPGQGQGQGQGKSQGEGQPSQEGQQPGGEQGADQGNPARRRLEQAEEKMQEARRRLEEAKRDGAAEEQQKAIEALEQAKAELENILRQLREEERARMLAQLESRFRKMLDMQIQVHEGTKRVDRKPEPERNQDDEIEAGRLSRKEAEIVGEADRALAVLREEGSAVAMPEAVGEMREDMEQIVVRLAQAKVNDITQKIEEDVIAALEEMIAALQKAQKDLNDKKMRNGQPGEPMEPGLVDQLSEIKMIRAMQMRVNNRTQRYTEILKTSEQAEQPELLRALKQLADREERIYRVTRDIVVGRNQ